MRKDRSTAGTTILQTTLKEDSSAGTTIDQLYYHGPGTRFGASRPFDHAKSIDFCTFLRHFLGLEWLWTTGFFFQFAWKTQSMFGDVLVQRWHWENSHLSEFHPCRSRQSLATAPGRSSWPEFRKGDILEEEQSISHWRKNASLDNKEPEESDESLFSKKKKCESFGSDLRGSVQREMGRMDHMHRHWAFARQKSTQTKQSRHLQNRHSNQTLDHLFFYPPPGSFQKKKKSNGSSIFSYRGTRMAELIAARRCTRSTSVLVLRAEQFSSQKISVLPISKLSRLFQQCWFLRGQQWAHIRCAVASRSTTLYQAIEGFARQLHNFFFRKKTAIGQSKNPRTVRKKRKVLAGIRDRRTSTGEGGKRWASSAVFRTAKCKKY